jgi:hypothetical protein
VPRPLQAAVDDISVEDIEHALNSASPQHRRLALGSVGIPNAARVSPALCRDFLARLRRATKPRPGDAAKHLTHALRDDILDVARASRRLRPGMLRPLTNFWSPALIRLALWANVSANAEHAEVWLWACEQEWFTGRAEHVQSVRRAASRVAQLAARASHADDGASGGPAEPAGPQDIGEALDRLAARLADAQAAAGRVVRALEREECPERDDAKAVERFVDSFDEAGRLVSAMAGAEERDAEPADSADSAEGRGRSVAVLRRRAQAALNHQADQSLRDDLGALAGLRATVDDAGLVGPADAARTRAAELLGLPAWEEPDRNAATSLRALTAMVRLDPSTPGYSSRLLELQRDFEAGADPAWLRLGFAYGRLSLDPLDASADADADAEDGAHARPSPAVAAVEPTDAPREPDRGGGGGTEASPPRNAPSWQRTDTAAPAAAPDADVPRVATAERHHPAAADEATTPAEPPAPAAALIPQQPTPRSVAHREDLAAFVADGRFGLAALLAEAAREAPTRIAVLRICAWAASLNSDTGSCAARLRGAVQELDASAVVDDPVDRLLLTPALLHTVIVTGDPGAGTLIDGLADRLSPELGEAGRAVGRRAQRGILTECPVLSIAADAAGLEAALAEARAECRGQLAGTPKFGFRPASAIAREWLTPEGPVGRLLSLAADDRRDQLSHIGERLRELMDPAVLQSRLDEAYWRVVKSGTRPLQGRNRHDLVRAIQERLRSVQVWVSCVRQVQAKGSWAAQETRSMLDELLSGKETTLARLAEPEDAPEDDPGGDLLGRAAIQAARAWLLRVYALLEGQDGLPVQELPAGLAGGGELLKVPGIRYDESSDEVLGGTPTVETVRVAARRTWAEAVRDHVAAERFDTADQLLELAGRGLLPGAGGETLPDDLHGLTREAGKQVAEELARAAEALEARLRTARVHNVIDEATERDLEHRLRDAEPVPDRDLAAVRSGHAALTGELNRAWERETARYRARLAELTDATEEDRERVRGLLRLGDLLTAEQMLNSLAKGEGIPVLPDRGEFFRRFFPAVPEALPEGVTRDLVDVVRARGTFAGVAHLSFSRLSRENASTTADALDAWRQMGERQGRERIDGLKESESLAPALRLLGLRNPRPARQDRLPRGKEHRFLVLNSPELLGEAPVPEFGSARGRRLHVLLAWGEPEPKRLQSWIDQDPEKVGLIVAHFGTLDPQRRAELAALAVDSPRPVIVLDDAALAFLAANGDGQWDSALRVLLPFSGVNPYLSKKRAQVPKEMFFGRDTELEEVSSPRGAQVVYGGRGLGKSALLQEAGNRFLEQNRNARCRVSLSLDSAGFGNVTTAEHIWGLIARELEKAGALSVPKRMRQASGGPGHEQVRRGMTAWLEADADRELLILLDEADKFFDSDFPEFLQTRRLRDLGRETGDRVKVVFAGLRSVQRFTAAANSPFSHLAQEPVVVGPLRPSDAAELLVQPLAALGYRFEDDDVVHSVLGHCSYQPYLIQMFSHRLVRALHRRRRAAAEAGQPLRPPFEILRADVGAVQSDERLRESITDTFRDTLRLDSRYTVIANTTAYHAYQHTLEATMSESELRGACSFWWPAGFENLNPDEFRAYLTELEGLGVLARDRDRRGWHLSSTNALSMIGGLSSVENELMTASNLQEPERFAALEPRHRLADGSYLPMTAAQVRDVLRRNATQARIVLGTPATGIDVVADRLRRCARDSGWEAPEWAGRAAFKQALAEGKPHKRRLVVDDLTGKAPATESCGEAVDWARTLLPAKPHVTRSAVVVASPDQLKLWPAVLGPHCPMDLGVVLLQRYTEQGLWARAVDQQQFASESSFPCLLEVTGGWPALVDEAMARGNGRRALETLKERLRSREGAEAFLTTAGVGTNAPLRPPFAALAAGLGSGDAGLSLPELAEWLESENARLPEGLTTDETVWVLHAMQLFRHHGVDTNRQALYTLDPVVLSCWRDAAA